MTDREYIESIFTEIRTKLGAVIKEYDLEEVRFILAKNQNAPPLGEADGSFTPEQWEQCRHLLQLFEDLK